MQFPKTRKVARSPLSRFHAGTLGSGRGHLVLFRKMEALMLRTLDQRYVKPTLEHLEERIQPSFLLGSGSGTGNVTALAVPLTKAATDMTTASNLLASDIASLKSAGTVAQAEKDYGFCCADY